MTLFSYPELIIRRFKDDFNLDVSSEFLSCADNQLTPIFFKHTGLKFGKNLCLSFASKWESPYDKGETSKLLLYLFVNHNWNKLPIVWKTKSGKIIDVSDTSIDCNDIVFDFENLEVDLYKSQMLPLRQEK
jgi:hypothetical protein